MIDRLIAALIVFAFALACVVYFGIMRFGKGRAIPGPCDAQAATPDNNRKMEIIVTSTDKRFARQAPREFRSAAAAPGLPVIEIHPEKRYQQVLGFGAAITDAACVDIELLDADERAKLLHNLFGPSEMAFNVVRVNIGSSDYAPRLRSLCESEPADPVLASMIAEYNKKHGTKYPIPMKADPYLKTFSLAWDEEHIIPLLKDIYKYSPHLWIKAAAWSPPGWMKLNQSMEGGNMQRTYMPAYAKYLAKFVQGYAQHGVTVNSITANNEVDTDQDGRMAACMWSGENEALFVGSILGPEFRRQGIATEIWLCDHNYNQWGRVWSQLEVKEVRNAAKGIAMHGYGGEAEKMTVLHNQFPDLGIYWTEGGPDITDPNYAKDWVKWSKTITEVMRNWARCFIAWNIALDEEGKPNIGPFPCGGVVTINKNTREISYSGQYFALGQFSRFVKRDAVRIDSEGTVPDVSHVAFVNPDGKMVAVLSNSADTAHTVAVKLDGQVVDVDLEPNSVTTLVF